MEVGCAVGFLLDEARQEGWNVNGVEPSNWASDYAKNKFGLDVFCGTIETANFPNSNFDVIVLSDTIEHLADPKQALYKIRRILKPDGVLYINTPDINSLSSRIFKARWWGINQFHLYYFNKATLNQLLTATGFKIIKWGSYSRTFTILYWLEKLRNYNKGLFKKLKFLAKPSMNNKLVTMNIGDQIEVIAQKRRILADFTEAERDEENKRKEEMKVIVVLPAYNAAKTLTRTVKDIPREIVDEIILVDDASKDNTVEVAQQLGLTVFAHDKNKGYGANQKTCYSKALEHGADIVVMVHPDYQYDPTAIPDMIAPIQKGTADAVFGSRMLKGGALEGGMPAWKHNCNIIFTAIANVILRTYLTEYHSGFRAYSAGVLRSIKFMDNSNNFVFDTEIILQILLHYFKIDEVPIRTRYFEEASVITLWNGFWYGVQILIALFKFTLHKNNIIRFRQFE